MTSTTTANSRVDLRLDNGVARCVWEDEAGLSSTLTDTAPLALNTPVVITATSIAGAQKLRVGSAQVATDAKSFFATTFDAHIIGHGYYGYDFKEGFGSTVFAAVVGKGEPTTLELGVLERYLLSVAGIASTAPPAPETAPITPTTNEQLSTATFNYGGTAQKGAWLQTQDPYVLLPNGSVASSFPVDIQTWVDRSPNASNLVEANAANAPHGQLNNGVRKINIWDNFVSTKGGSGEAGVDVSKGFVLAGRFFPLGYAVRLWSDEGAVNTGRFLRWFGAGANAATGAGDLEFSVGNGTGRVSVRSAPGNIVTTAPHEGPVQPFSVMVHHDTAAQTLNMTLNGQVTSVPFTGTFAAGVAGYSLTGQPAVNMESNLDVYESLHVHNRLDAALRSQWLTRFSGPAAPATPPPPAPTPPPAGTNAYPFGSRLTAYPFGIKPNGANTNLVMDNACKALYNHFKTNIQPGFGGKYSSFNGDPNAYVSEGHGYGMLITALMAGYDAGAKALFDGFFASVRARPAYNNLQPYGQYLMNWRADGDGYNAIDGDLDIAMGLLLADRQWGSAGAINYRQQAILTINACKFVCFDTAGFSLGCGTATVSRTSDYMFNHFRAFKRATGDAFWDLVITKEYQLLEDCQANFAPSTGLLPELLFNTGTAPRPASGVGPPFEANDGPQSGDYFYNACRIPWRVGTDYVMSGDIRAKRVCEKIAAFFIAKTGGAGGNAANITGQGYKLDGTQLFPNAGYHPPVFIGPTGPGCMTLLANQQMLNSIMQWVVNNPARGYYATELELLSMIVMSGNWFDPI